VRADQGAAGGSPPGRLAPGAAPLGALAFLLLGAALRTRGITGFEPWIDEYGTWWTIAGGGWGDVWQRALAVQPQSPLYYLVVRASSDLLGGGLLALRLPSLVCGVALIALGYVAAFRLLGDRRIALAATAALALDERLIFYSRNARPYALALLCAMASFLLYAELLRGGGRRARLGWVLATAATCYAHYLFGVVLLAQGLHCAMQGPRRRGALRRAAPALALLGALLMPAAVQVAGIHGRRQLLDWVPRGDGALASLSLALELLDLPVLAWVCGAVLLVVWIDRQRIVRVSRAGPGIVLLWLSVPVLFFAAVLPLLGVNLLHERYLLVAVPAVGLLYGALLGASRSAWLGWLPLAVFVCATGALRIVPMLEGQGRFGGWYHEQRWSEATALLVAHHRAGDLVLYGTGFLELDAAVRGEGTPARVGFAEWPVRAYLPPDRAFRLRPLPYSDTADMDRRVLETLAEEPRAERVWIIGLSESVRRAARLARDEGGLRVSGHRKHGFVELVLMTR